MGNQFRRLKPETIIHVLYRLRGEIIREGQDGLEHVDALLRLRGADPDARRVPPKVPKVFGRRNLRRAILNALRDGPRTGAQVAATVTEGRGMTPAQARAAVYPALCKLRDAGVLCAPRKDNRGRLMWEIAH